MQRAQAFLVLVMVASLSVAVGEERSGFNTAAAYSFPVTVSDGAGGSQTLWIGVDPSGTDGIDAVLGEVEQPPCPPAGVFDARLIGDDVFISGMGEGVLADYRQGGANFTGFCEHELKYQVGKGTTITIAWDLPAWAIGHLQDLISGNIVNVTMRDGNTSLRRICRNPPSRGIRNSVPVRSESDAPLRRPCRNVRLGSDEVNNCGSPFSESA
jgi:hypothetical protein